MAEAAKKEEETTDDIDMEKIHDDLHADDEVSDDTDDDSENNDDEASPEEEEALAEGWKPDGKDKDGNSLTAHEYLSRRPLFQRIKNLNEKIEGLTTTVESLQTHNKVTSAKAIAERDKLVTELTAAKKAAFKDMDIEEAERIDKELESIPDIAAPTEAPRYTKDQWDDQHKTFVDDNGWYKDNAGLSAAANDFGREFMQENPNCSPKQLYKDVVARVKESFPDSFQKRRRSTSVSTNSTRTKPNSSKEKHTFNDIPQEHQAMARVVINSGVKEEEYLKQYFMMGE